MEKDLRKFNIDKFQKLVNIYIKGFDFELERQISIIGLFTDKTIDEVEDLDLDEFALLVNEINDISFDSFSTEFIYKIEVDGKTFASSIDGEYKPKVKDIHLINEYTTKNIDDFIKYIAAVLFKPVDENGLIIRDYTSEGINDRAELFKDKLSIDILSPYLNLLSIKLINNEVSK